MLPNTRVYTYSNKHVSVNTDGIPRTFVLPGKKPCGMEALELILGEDQVSASDVEHYVKRKRLRAVLSKAKVFTIFVHAPASHMLIRPISELTHGPPKRWIQHSRALLASTGLSRTPTMRWWQAAVPAAIFAGLGVVANRHLRKYVRAKAAINLWARVRP